MNYSQLISRFKIYLPVAEREFRSKTISSPIYEESEHHDLFLSSFIPAAKDKFLLPNPHLVASAMVSSTIIGFILSDAVNSVISRDNPFIITAVRKDSYTHANGEAVDIAPIRIARRDPMWFKSLAMVSLARALTMWWDDQVRRLFGDGTPFIDIVVENDHFHISTKTSGALKSKAFVILREKAAYENGAADYEIWQRQGAPMTEISLMSFLSSSYASSVNKAMGYIAASKDSPDAMAESKNVLTSSKIIYNAISNDLRYLLSPNYVNLGLGQLALSNLTKNVTDQVDDDAVVIVPNFAWWATKDKTQQFTAREIRRSHASLDPLFSSYVSPASSRNKFTPVPSQVDGVLVKPASELKVLSNRTSRNDDGSELNLDLMLKSIQHKIAH